MKRLAGLISTAALVFTVGCGQSDTGITTSVKSRLAADETVKAYQIDVDTHERVVTLNGEVASMAAKERAVQIASTTNGVRDVVDNLRLDETAATSGVRDDVDVDVDVDPDLKDDASRAGDVIESGAKETGAAVKDGAQKVKEGAEKVGSKIVDSVTDDDRDSDRDGK